MAIAMPLLARCRGITNDGRDQQQFTRRGGNGETGTIVGRMKVFGFRTVATLATMIAAALIAGCAGIPQDDRYQTHDGGRSNTRAEAPAAPLTRPS